MNKLEFTALVQNGWIPGNMDKMLRDVVGKMEGQRLSFTVAPYKKTRSRNQNSFFHGPFLNALHEMFVEAGNDYDRKTIKEQVKAKFGLRETIISPDGGVTEVALSTRKYTTAQMEDFMTKIRVWAAPFKQLPLPNEGQYE